MILHAMAWSLMTMTISGGGQESPAAALLREADETFGARKYIEALDEAIEKAR
jgi:hypothetical protein